MKSQVGFIPIPTLCAVDYFGKGVNSLKVYYIKIPVFLRKLLLKIWG